MYGRADNQRTQRLKAYSLTRTHKHTHIHMHTRPSFDLSLPTHAHTHTGSRYLCTGNRDQGKLPVTALKTPRESIGGCNAFRVMRLWRTSRGGGRRRHLQHCRGRCYCGRGGGVQGRTAAHQPRQRAWALERCFSTQLRPGPPTQGEKYCNFSFLRNVKAHTTTFGFDTHSLQIERET